MSLSLSRVSVSSDYAHAQALNHDFYYGYEETAPDPKCLAEDKGTEDEIMLWCFVAKVDGKEVLRRTQEQLHMKDCFSCAEGLLRGIMQYLEWAGVAT